MKESGYEQPTPIQMQAIPVLLQVYLCLIIFYYYEIGKEILIYKKYAIVNNIRSFFFFIIRTDSYWLVPQQAQEKLQLFYYQSFII